MMTISECILREIAASGDADEVPLVLYSYAEYVESLTSRQLELLLKQIDALVGVAS
jgi:hypothetical protein